MEALAHLERKEYRLAAVKFLDISHEAIVNPEIAPYDVAAYGGLCAIAGFSREELKIRVIDTGFLDPAPDVRELVHRFYAREYAICVECLNTLEHNQVLNENYLKDLSSEIVYKMQMHLDDEQQVYRLQNKDDAISLVNYHTKAPKWQGNYGKSSLKRYASMLDLDTDERFNFQMYMWADAIQNGYPGLKPLVDVMIGKYTDVDRTEFVRALDNELIPFCRRYDDREPSEVDEDDELDEVYPNFLDGYVIEDEDPDNEDVEEVRVEDCLQNKEEMVFLAENHAAVKNEPTYLQRYLSVIDPDTEELEDERAHIMTIMRLHASVEGYVGLWPLIGVLEKKFAQVSRAAFLNSLEKDLISFFQRYDTVTEVRRSLCDEYQFPKCGFETKSSALEASEEDYGNDEDCEGGNEDAENRGEDAEDRGEGNEDAKGWGEDTEDWGEDAEEMGEDDEEHIKDEDE